jgi:hypothetical protein
VDRLKAAASATAFDTATVQLGRVKLARELGANLQQTTNIFDFGYFSIDLHVLLP